MASLTEFTIFLALPFELRLKIWEHVPQPKRVIGQLPCSKCWKSLQSRENGRGGHSHSHTQWHLRFIGNNQDEAIYPPLHACRESRAAWLPRYFSPPRYLHLRQEQEDIQHHYETDVFTVFDTGTSFLGFDVDPFLGFDRQRIQNVAISENTWSLAEAIAAVAPQRIPALTTLSMLVLGPDPDVDGSTASGWQEMPAVDVQHIDCDVHDLSEKLIIEHPLFGKSRLRHLVFEPEPRLRQLINYSTFFKAWLWHGSHWDDHEARIPADIWWWDFYNYLFEEDVDVCPLGNVPGWCPGHHTKDEMLNWSSSFAVNFKFLVAKRCMAELISSSALALDPAENYERFVQFREKRIVDFKTRKSVE